MLFVYVNICFLSIKSVKKGLIKSFTPFTYKYFNLPLNYLVGFKEIK